MKGFPGTNAEGIRHGRICLQLGKCSYEPTLCTVYVGNLKQDMLEGNYYVRDPRSLYGGKPQLYDGKDIGKYGFLSQSTVVVGYTK